MQIAVLFLEIREDDAHTESLVACLHHSVAAMECEAERAFLRRLAGGCRVPVGVDCCCSGGTLSLSGAVLATDGQAEFRAQGECVADTAAAQQLGARLADEIQACARKAGRVDILEEVALIGS